MSFKSWFKSHNMQIQFWGYEGGNLTATVAAAGGFTAFGKSVLDTFNNNALSTFERASVLSSDYPDATVAVGLGAVVLATPLIRNGVKHLGSIAVNTVDVGSTAAAASIVGYALSEDSNWITVSASSFVVGSSFLRHAGTNPFMLKLGGIGLAFGGAALTMFGIDGVQNHDLSESMLDYATIGTGYYVTAAGLLTYEGGIYETVAYNDSPDHKEKSTFTSQLLHPVNGALAQAFKRVMDAPIQTLNKKIINPSIFWVDRETKHTKPFSTSMQARMPWRVITGVAALVSATEESYAFASAFIFANVLWALGDIAIGSLDWQDGNAHESLPPQEHRPHLP